MTSATICQFPSAKAPERACWDETCELGAVDAPAEISAPGGMVMPCVVGVLSDIAMRVWCTRAVATELLGARGFATAARLPELTVRIHLPLGKRTITTTAVCNVSEVRVAEDGGFVLDLRVGRIGVEASEAVRRFRRERGRAESR